jgi:hypothetical protein
MPLNGNSLSNVARRLKPCAQPRHLRRTSTIALVVGSWLTLFNQGEVLASGHVSAVLLLKVLLNYLTPFVVANLGLLSAERKCEATEQTSSETPSRKTENG